MSDFEMDVFIYDKSLELENDKVLAPAGFEPSTDVRLGLDRSASDHLANEDECEYFRDGGHVVPVIQGDFLRHPGAWSDG